MLVIVLQRRVVVCIPYKSVGARGHNDVQRRAEEFVVVRACDT